MNVPRTEADKQKFVELWHGRLERSYRSRVEEKERWEVLREYYKGNYFEGWDLEQDRVAPWLHFVTVRQMAANLYFQDPSFNFIGRTVKGIQDAEMSRQLYLVERRVMNAEMHERTAIDYALKYGVGILKHGWNSKYGRDPAWADQKQRQSSKFESTKPASHEDLNLPLGPMTEHDSSVHFGHANIRAIAPWDFLIDADSLTYEEAPWCAHRFQRRWSDVIRDTRYDKAARKKLEESGPSGLSEHYYGDDDIDTFDRDSVHSVDSAMSTLYEIYDKSAQMIVVISPDCDLPLVMKDYDYQGKDGPYSILQFFPRDDSFWGIPYMDTFTNEVLTYNKALTNASDHYQRFTSRTRGMYMDSYIGESDMKKLAEAEAGEYVPVRSLPAGMKLQDVIDHIPAPPISGDTWSILDIFKSLHQQTSGISENDLGSGKGVQTATEASIIQAQSSLRKGDMRFRVDMFLRDSARKTVTLMRQLMDNDQVIPVVGPEGIPQDYQIPGAVLNGAYDVEIEPGSTERVDRAARFRQSIELFREFAQAQPILQQQGYQVNLGEIAKSILKESEIIKNPDRVIVPMGQPQMLPPQPPQLTGPTMNAAGGAPSPALATVNARGGMPESTDAFQMGRTFSESMN